MNADAINIQLSVGLFVAAALVFVTGALLLALAPAGTHSLVFVMAATFAVVSATTGGQACAIVRAGKSPGARFSYQAAWLYCALVALLAGACFAAVTQ